VDDTMERFGLGPLAGARMGELSRGFERRVVLARAWLHRPAVLILDDPATGLDDDGCDRLAREILRHLDAGGSALIASGRRDELARWCDHIGVMTDTGVTVVGASSDAPPRSPEVGQRVADRRD
jgi:ABC-2 type transport system ATP-binding protein